MGEIPKPSESEEVMESFPSPETYQVINGEPGFYVHQVGDAEVEFGAYHHSNDPEDPMIAGTRKRVEDFHPQLVLHESYDWPIDGSDEEIIRKYGEPALVRKIAAELGIASLSWEPGRERELAEYGRQFGLDQTAAFYILRQVWQYQRQEQKADFFEAEYRASLEDGFMSMGHELDWLQTVGIIEQELGVPFRPEEKAFQDLAHISVDPTQAANRNVFNEIASYTGYFRDKHMVAELKRLSKENQRIFAAMGSSHYHTVKGYLG